jgi:predicted nucleic acid-binding protein
MALFLYSRSKNISDIIKAALRKKGKPIPENDIWIAAIALRNNLAIVTQR